jgi:hypothetical protein
MDLSRSSFGFATETKQAGWNIESYIELEGKTSPRWGLEDHREFSNGLVEPFQRNVSLL